jgi:homoserine O-acetyltransferase
MKIVMLVRLACYFFVVACAVVAAHDVSKPNESDFIVHDFHFKSGEVLPELKLHFATYGKPEKDASGRITNAILIMHGTGGSGQQFTGERFAGVLFGPGQLLDANRYFIILPDAIGHGHSSKPSDGLRAKFPHYDYDDMVQAQYLLLTQGLKVNHLRLVMGTSMGCMHSWVWLVTYTDFMDAAMPLACLPVQIAGRNRMLRKLLMESITSDPGWMNGDYKQQPYGLRSAVALLLAAAGSSLQMYKDYPTRDKADAYVESAMRRNLEEADANDLLYQFNASRNYDPSGKLASVKVPVMFVNSADDLINPPELGIAEREIRKVKRGKFVLLPITDQTRGHGTHTLPTVWKQYLAELLKQSR